jgi:hypothetical protein
LVGSGGIVGSGEIWREESFFEIIKG